MSVFLQHLITGLTNGSLIALIALGYTMVYGIIELVNFAHGDLLMLGCCLAFSLALLFGLENSTTIGAVAVISCMFVVVPLFAGSLNLAIDRVVYRPLRDAPRLVPLVSAIGASFVLLNVGLLWLGPADRPFPNVVANTNLLEDSGLRFTVKDLLVVAVTIPSMVALTLFVKYTKLGTAMRATAQDRVAAQLMGVPSNRVIGATFFIGGALAGVGSVMFALYYNIIGYQMGFQNGLYAFTAAVLGGIGKIPGAVVGGLLIGVIRSLGSGYVGERWTSALIFMILIVVLIFRPSGILGERRREKV